MKPPDDAEVYDCFHESPFRVSSVNLEDDFIFRPCSFPLASEFFECPLMTKLHYFKRHSHRL